MNEFRAKLIEEGTSYEEMREQIRKEMSIQQVQQGKLRSRIQISEQEVTNRSEEHTSELQSHSDLVCRLLLEKKKKKTKKRKKKKTKYQITDRKTLQYISIHQLWNNTK